MSESEQYGQGGKLNGKNKKNTGSIFDGDDDFYRNSA